MMGGGSCSSSSEFGETDSTANNYTRDRTPEEIMKLLQPPKWQCPSENWLQINFSVDMDYTVGVGGIGVVIREYEGNIVEAIATHYVHQTYQYGVAWTAYLGLSRALTWQDSKIHLEVEGQTDTSLILNHSSIACEEAMRVLDDVRQLLRRDNNQQFRVSACIKSQNEATRWLAKEAKMKKISQHWMQNLKDLPHTFVQICEIDREDQ